MYVSIQYSVLYICISIQIVYLVFSVACLESEIPQGSENEVFYKQGLYQLSYWSASFRNINTFLVN